MVDIEKLRSMVMSFRVQELQALLTFRGINKFGRKPELQARAIELLKNPNDVYMKIHELFSKLSQGAINDVVQSQQQQSQASGGKCPGNQVMMNPLTVNQKRELVPASKFNNHPNVKFRSLSFYDILGELIKPTSMIPSQFQKTQEATFTFQLTPQQATDLASNRDISPCSKLEYLIQVHIRFCSLQTSGQQDDDFPPSINIKVNGRVCPLPNLIPSNKPGVQPKRLRLPVNITPLVRMSPTVTNNVFVSWNHEQEDKYIIAVFLVHKLTSQDLLQKLETKGVHHPSNTIKIITETLKGDADCELANSTLQVSLLCPLGKSRMTTPCKAFSCLHLQCFDASLYLQMNEKKPTWICPICYKPAIFENLLIDGYFKNVIMSSLLPPDSNEIILFENGSWSSLGCTETTQLLSTPETTIVEVDCDEPTIINDEVMGKSGRKNTNDDSLIDLTNSDDEDQPFNPQMPKYNSSGDGKKALIINPVLSEQTTDNSNSHSSNIFVLNSLSLTGTPTSMSGSQPSPSNSNLATLGTSLSVLKKHLDLDRITTPIDALSVPPPDFITSSMIPYLCDSVGSSYKETVMDHSYSNV